jgi:hypothetical protein
VLAFLKKGVFVAGAIVLSVWELKVLSFAKIFAEKTNNAITIKRDLFIKVIRFLK